MLEISAGLGVIAMIIIFSSDQVRNAIFGVRTSQAFQEINELVLAAVEYRAVEGDYTDISIEDLVDNGYRLQAYTDGVGENVYGEDIDIDPADSNGNADVEYTFDTQESCEQIESRLDLDNRLEDDSPACTTAGVLSFTIL